MERSEANTALDRSAASDLVRRGQIELLSGGYYEPSLGERVVVVLCGANTDPRTLSLA